MSQTNNSDNVIDDWENEDWDCKDIQLPNIQHEEESDDEHIIYRGE